MLSRKQIIMGLFLFTFCVASILFGHYISFAASPQIIYPYTYYSPGVLYEKMETDKPQDFWQVSLVGDNLKTINWKWGNQIGTRPEWQSAFLSGFQSWNDAHIENIF
jgi:hypothetical protein